MDQVHKYVHTSSRRHWAGALTSKLHWRRFSWRNNRAALLLCCFVLTPGRVYLHSPKEKIIIIKGPPSFLPPLVMQKPLLIGLAQRPCGTGFIGCCRSQLTHNAFGVIWASAAKVTWMDISHREPEIPSRKLTGSSPGEHVPALPSPHQPTSAKPLGPAPGCRGCRCSLRLFQQPWNPSAYSQDLQIFLFSKVFCLASFRLQNGKPAGIHWEHSRNSGAPLLSPNSV